MKDILKIGIDAAIEAGKFLLDNLGRVNRIERKHDRSLATNLDKEAEKIIVDKLRCVFPHHGIIAEEGGEDDSSKDYLWIVDPLDGTHNFIRDINIFGVSIGVVYRGNFVAGVIYMPASDELYTGEKGQGAYKNNKKIYVSSENNLGNCSVSFDSSIKYSPAVMLKVLGDIAKEVFNIRMLGSSARMLSYIGEGRLDAAIEFNDRPWDFAGGVSIIEEAGGKLTDLKGGALTYKTIGYIASNGLIHENIKNIVASHLK